MPETVDIFNQLGVKKAPVNGEGEDLFAKFGIKLAPVENLQESLPETKTEELSTPQKQIEKPFDFAEAQKIGLEAITKGEPEEEWKKKNILEKAGIRPEAEMLTKMFKGELPEQVQAFENPTFNSAFNMVYDIGKTGLDLVSGISGFVVGAGASLFALTAPEGAAREKALKDAKGIEQIVGSLFGLQEKLPPSAVSEVINTTAALPFNMVLSMMHAGIETLPLSETNKTKAHIFGDVAAVIGGAELVNKTALKSINKILGNVEGTSTANKFRVAAARKMIDEQLVKQRDMEIILSPAENIANVGRVVDVVGDAIEIMPKEQQLDLFNNVKGIYSQDNLVKQFTPEQLALFERPPEQLELPLAVSEKGEKLTVKDLVNAEGKLSIPKGATFTRQYELPMEFPVKDVDLEGVKRIKAVEEQERVRAELEKPAPEIKKPKLTEKESYNEWLSKEMEIEDKVSKAGQEEFKLIPEEQPSIMEGLARIVGEIKGYSAEQIKDSITKAKDPNGIIADAFNGELSAAVNMRRRGNDIEAQRMIERIIETANRIKQEFPEFDKIVDAKLEVIKGADVALGQLGLPLYEKVGKEKIAAPEESGQPKEAKPIPLPEGKGKEPIKVKPIDIMESFLENKGYSPQKIKAIINEIGKKPELVSKWLEKNVSSEKRAEIIAKLEGKETPEIKGQRVTFEEGTERGRKGLDNITDEDYEAASKRFVGNLGKVVSAIREAKLSGTLDFLGLPSAYEALAKVHKNLKDVPFEQMKQDLQKIATYLIRQGKEKVNDFVKRMTDKWGSYIEPFARDAWKQAEELEGFKKGEEVTEKFTPVEKVDLKKELLIVESELKRYENSVFVTPEGLKEKTDRYEKALTAFEKSETSQMAPAAKSTEGRLKNHSELISELKKVKTADDLVFVTKRVVTKDPISDSMIEMIQSSEEMKKLLKAIPVKVTTNIPLSEEARSEYVPKQKGAQININLYKGHQLDDIVFGIIHELGHAGLSRKLAVDAKARASLQELLDYIINEKLTLGERHAIKLVTERMKQKKDTGFTEAQEHKYYHLGDISEFGAGIISSRAFQKFTSEIEWPGKQHGAPKSNVWKEAVSRIYDFFFPKWNKPKNITVFEEAFKRIGTIMEQPEPKFVSQEMMKNLAPRKESEYKTPPEMKKEVKDMQSDVYKQLVFHKFKEAQTEHRELLSKWGDPDKMVSQRKINDMLRAPISEAEQTMMKSITKDVDWKEFMTSPSWFERIDKSNGTVLHDLFRRNMEDVGINSKHELAERKRLVHEKLRRLKIHVDDLMNVGANEIARQEGGKKILDAQGIEVKPMTKQQIETDQLFRDFYESDYERLQEARILAGQKPLGYIKDYATFRRIMDDFKTKGINPITASEALWLKGLERPFPFEERDIRSQRLLEINALKMFLDYSSYSVDYIHKAPVIAKLRELVEVSWGKKDDKSLQDTAPALYAGLNRWLNIQAGLPSGRFDMRGTKSDYLLKKITGNVAAAVMTYNFRPVVIQFSALNTTIAEVGVRSFVNGLMDWTFSKEKRDFAWKEGNLITRANETVIEDSLYDLTQRMAKGTGSLKDKSAAIYGAVKQKGYAGIVFLDAIAAKIGWLAAYDRGIKESNDHKFSRKYANEVVVRTQGSAASTDVAPIQTYTIGKALTVFNTFSIARANWYVDVFGEMVHGDRKAAFTLALRFMIATAIINTIYEDILGMKSPEPAPIKAMIRSAKEDDEGMKILWEGIKELYQQVPVIGGRYGQGLGGAVFELVQETLSYPIRKIEPGVAGYVPPYGEVDLVGKWLGVPSTSQLLKVLKAGRKDREDIREYITGRIPGSEEE